MATLSAFSPPSWPDPNSNATFLSEPSDADSNATADDHDPQSPPPNPNLNLHNNDSFSPPSESTPPASRSPPSLFHLSFNQDYACFAVGTDHGFRIYNCDPFRELFRRDFDNGGGIGVVEMLFRCNILSIVGGGARPSVPHQQGDRIVVVLEQKIFVYNFADLKLLHQIETIANPKGLCAVSQVAGSLVLVCPGLQKGQLLATASSKGTLIRIFNTLDGSLLQEVRRGADRAEIYSLAFSSTAQWLAVSSDKGTVHVFNLKVNSGSSGNEMRTSSDSNIVTSSSNSSLSFIRGVLPKYFNSEWSVAQFRLLEGSQYLVAFGHQKNTVVILGMDGSFYRCQFDPVNGGEMTQLEYHNFLKPEEAF
ncbi:hypothetical protein M0R45_011131 [Rubus argutus]|uniref:Autophagy-related protein 18a n=1 Tax=Rubus argutus TaxID=59490 RepID=A0AAW1YBT5_RUBAR